MNQPPGLEGRVIIITGGGGLLGRQYARALSSAGANIVVADIDPAKAAAAAAFAGGRALPLGVNVADKASVQSLVRETITAFGRVDGLLNNAALDPKFDADHQGEHALDFEHYPLELWNQSLAVNVTGMFLCAQAVAPSMLAQGTGVIVNVSSTYGLVGPDQRLYEPTEPDGPRRYKPVDYSVTKSAVLGLTRYLAAYWRKQGIRVNTLSLGGVYNDHDPEFVARYSARTLLGRMAEVDEYCGAVEFLFSDASSYMTGSNLVIDGGWTAW